MRTVCLRSHPLCRSLAAARSLVAICPASLVPLVPSWGVVGCFMGFSDCYLVGVGVSQNMPVNRILWLLTGIFGDVVSCPFSALPVASFLPICPALRSLSAAASWRLGGRVSAASWEKRRVCVLSCPGPFSASCVMGWTVPGSVCRAGRVSSAGRRACLYRLARPLPFGAGDYVRPAVIGSACCEGVGVSSRFSLSRCSSSCHLVAPVVIASLCLLRRPVLVVPCSHRSRLPCSMCFVPCPVALSSCPLVVIPVFSYGFLIASLPVLVISWAGRSLLARFLFVAALAPPTISCPRACLPPLIVHRSFSSSLPCVSCDRRLMPPLALPPVSLVSYRPPPVRLVSPSFDKCERGACRLVLACLSHRSRRAGGWRCRLDGVVAWRGGVSAGCVRFVVSSFVYIIRVLARVSWLLSKESD